MIYIIFALSTLFIASYSEERRPGTHIDHHKSLTKSNRKICIIGDSGTGTPNQLAVAKALEKAKCTQVRHVGDIIYPSGLTSVNDEQLQEKFYKPYKNVLEKSTFFLTQGNHDYKNKQFDAWIHAAAKDDRIYYPSHYYSETWKGICFITLETNFYEKLYHFEKRKPQTDWLKKTYSDFNGKCNFTVVFAHHPYKSSGNHGPAIPQLKTFLKKHIIGKVDMYIAGHDHVLSDEGYAQATRMLISGTAGKLSTPEIKSEDSRFVLKKFGFITLQFREDKDNRVVAHHKIHTVDVTEQSPISIIEWEGSTTGSGLR